MTDKNFPPEQQHSWGQGCSHSHQRSRHLTRRREGCWVRGGQANSFSTEKFVCRKKFWSRMFSAEICFSRKKFRPIFLGGWKTISAGIFFGRKIFGRKFFQPKKFSTNKLFGRKIVRPYNFWAKTFFDRKLFRPKKRLAEKCFRPKKISAENVFRSSRVSYFGHVLFFSVYFRVVPDHQEKHFRTWELTLVMHSQSLSHCSYFRTPTLIYTIRLLLLHW